MVAERDFLDTSQLFPCQLRRDQSLTRLSQSMPITAAFFNQPAAMLHSRSGCIPDGSLGLRLEKIVVALSPVSGRFQAG
jgi:hypothetical protein